MTTVAGLVGLIACVQYFIHLFVDFNLGSIWDWLDQYVFRIVPFQITLLPYGDRAYSSFPNPNMLAQYLVMAAPFVISFNFIERRNGLRLYSRICLILTFAGVMFSFSRGGYIAVILLAVALVVLNIRHRFTEVSLYIISTLLFLPQEVVSRLFTIKHGIDHSSTIAGGLANAKPHHGMLPSFTTSEIINNSGAESAVGERWEIWMEAITRFIERPLFGYGAGTQPTFAIYENIGIKAPHAHNIVLQLLLEGGIIALLIMGLIGFKTVKNGIVMMRNGYNSSFWIGFSLVAFAACFLSHGMVDYPLMVPRLICFFIIVLGFAEQTIHIYQPKDSGVREKLRNRWIRNRETTV